MSSLLEKYYPSYNNNTFYGLYCTSIQRFLIIDHHNIYSLFHTAQVLSSKINSVVIIFPGTEKNPKMDNESCLNFSLNHIKFNAALSSSDHSQKPTTIFLHNTQIVKMSFPVDFEKKDRKLKLLQLQKYAKFSNLCIHSIMLSSIMNQHMHVELLQKEYESFYFNKVQEPGLLARIMNILLFADTIQEAKNKIKEFWIELIEKNLEKIYIPSKVKKDFLGQCKMFYEIIGEEIPTEVTNLLISDVKI